MAELLRAHTYTYVYVLLRGDRRLNTYLTHVNVTYYYYHYYYLFIFSLYILLLLSSPSLLRPLQTPGPFPGRPVSISASGLFFATEQTQKVVDGPRHAGTTRRVQIYAQGLWRRDSRELTINQRNIVVPSLPPASPARRQGFGFYFSIDFFQIFHISTGSNKKTPSSFAPARETCRRPGIFFYKFSIRKRPEI